MRTISSALEYAYKGKVVATKSYDEFIISCKYAYLNIYNQQRQAFILKLFKGKIHMYNVHI